MACPSKGALDYTKEIDLDVSTIVRRSGFGPKRPQDRILLSQDLKNQFKSLIETPITEGGFGLSTSDVLNCEYPLELSANEATEIGAHRNLKTCAAGTDCCYYKLHQYIQSFRNDCRGARSTKSRLLKA